MNRQSTTQRVLRLMSVLDRAAGRCWLLGVLCCLLALPTATSAVTSAEANSTAEARYTCPMHPHYLSTDANGQCPICGMDLVPVREASTPASTRITIDPNIRQNIGIRTVAATIAPLFETLRAFGTVEADEDRQSVATARTEGWIESLAVRLRGARVEQGDLLYTVFSPALLAAQQDYLSALATSDRSRQRAIRNRLRSLGMQPPVIEQLARKRQVFEAVPVQAESTGIVESLLVRDGDYLQPGTEILRLQAYDQVWVLARIPETQLSLVRAEVPVVLTFPGAPAEPINATVDYIYPTLDRQTRTGEIRIRVPNPEGRLRPGAYVDVEVLLSSAERLTVPQDAVLYDSRGAVVIIAHGDGSFSRRAVLPGLSGKGRTAILDGLAVGERVVTNGQFLLDAEAKLRQGLDRFQPAALDTTRSNRGFDSSQDQAKLLKHEHKEHRGPAPVLPPAVSAEVFQGLVTDDRTLAAIDHLTDMALYLHEALIDGYQIKPNFLAPALAASRELQLQFRDTALGPILAAGRGALVKAEQARSGAELQTALATLVAALEPWLSGGAPAHYQAAGLNLFRDLEDGAFWLQEGTTPLNPYGDAPAERQRWATEPGNSQSAELQSASQAAAPAAAD